jgi:predicted outer membrane lipoprotein
MAKNKTVPFRDAIIMLSGYAKTRIAGQIRSVAFIIIYLIVFQTLILRVPLANAVATTGGIALVIFGLAFFLEGLVLGLMPLGERVGVKLPAKTGIIVIAIFGLILGFGATLAEPAISALRTAGSTVTAWDSPLLYMLLEHYTEWLVLSVGIGVGLAVALGMFRFYYNLPIKPFILIIIPVLLALSVYFSLDPNLNKIIGLAWDCGAVTTGAVTVPLVLALGIGVSRAAGKGKGTTSGFGIILLASAFPILSVLVLGLILDTRAPRALSEERFFSPAERDKALILFETGEELMRHAFTHGSEAGRRAFFADENKYLRTIETLKEGTEASERILGNMTLQAWIMNNASLNERNHFADTEFEEDLISSLPFAETIKQESLAGVRAVIPLSILLIIVLLGFLREKLKYKDEVALGIIFTLAGMILLTSGIKLGLASLGGEVGAQLPRAFSSEDKYIDRIIISNFDKDLLYKTIAPDGTQKTYFSYSDHDRIRPVEFFEEHYDENTGRYEYIIMQAPLFNSKLSVLGIILVLIFAFGMGYGATLAEPALNALGITVEGITVGTIKRKQIVQVVSFGVGMGILLGLCRILFDLPLVWLIVPTYLILIPLTIFSEEEFTAIAWDSGGVTTGPVTVPLVLAMGLSIGGELNISDGFGVLALASAFPILTVLLYGLLAQSRQRRSLTTQSAEEIE